MSICAKLAALTVAFAASIASGIPGGGVATAAECPPAPPADTSTPAGWIGYLASHPDDYGLLVTGDRRTLLSHNVNRQFPTASASKIINLAAYTRAVAFGRVSPSRTITVNEWERWYVPIDGGSHVKSLEYLKLPPLVGVPGSARPDSMRVTLDQLADVMIRFSDSAAPDALRATVGDAALLTVMKPYGLTGPPPLNAGLYLGLVDPTLTTQVSQQSAGRRYHDDAVYRAMVFTSAPSIALHTSGTQVARTYSQTPLALNALMRGIATGSFGPGSVRARQFLEFQGVAPNGSVVGFKGGSLKAADNSVLTENFELRSQSGIISTATLMVDRMSLADFTKSNNADQPLLLAAMTNPDATRLLQCAASKKTEPR